MQAKLLCPPRGCFCSSAFHLEHIGKLQCAPSRSAFIFNKNLTSEMKQKFAFPDRPLNPQIIQ